MTATSIIGTDDMEHQITFYHPGADSAGSWPELDTKDNNIQYAIVSPRDRLIMMQAVRWCEKEKIPFLFDPGQQITSLSNDELREGLDKGSGLIVNDYEWDMFSERLSLTPTEALERANIIIITHEEKGLSLHTREGQIDVAACTPDMVVNPTGAGDALRGGMLTGLNLGWPLTQSARLGASVASFVVQTEGTLVDDLTVEEVCERAKKNYGEALPALE